MTTAQIICGPKSAPIGAELMDTDPKLGMVRDGGRWWIVDKTTWERFGSPMDDQPPNHAGIGYLSRRQDGERVTVHVAGIHSLASRGVVHCLARHLVELHRTTGDESFSLAVRCQLDGLTITNSEILTGPHLW